VAYYNKVNNLKQIAKNVVVTVLNRVKFLKERVSLSKKVEMLIEKRKEEDHRLRNKKRK
jgi:hypothetical protein